MSVADPLPPTRLPVGRGPRRLGEVALESGLVTQEQLPQETTTLYAARFASWQDCDPGLAIRQGGSSRPMPTRIVSPGRKRSRQPQGGFTLVELLVVITILGVLAAIVLFNISSVSANAACQAMKTEAATIQDAADHYYRNTGAYPDSTPSDKASPAAGDAVNVTELKTANLLPQSPPATETFTYNAAPNGTVHGVLAGAACTYN